MPRHAGIAAATLNEDLRTADLTEVASRVLPVPRLWNVVQVRLELRSD